MTSSMGMAVISTGTVRRARVRGSDALQDIVLSDSAVVGVGPYADRSQWQVDDLDIGGRVVMPGLVDAHVHLDKAYVLDALEQRGFEGGGVTQAIAATKELRADSGPELVRAGMTRLLATMARQGTVAARAHVELDAGTDPAVIALHQELVAEQPGMHVQLVAFPQNGTTHSPNASVWMQRALDDGCVVVGGCPYADPAPLAHLELVFSLARERNLPVDLHLDLTDDVDAAQLSLVLPMVERFGLQGRVTLGHMTALSGLSPDGLKRAVAGLCDLGVSVIAIPTADLWLSGRSTVRPGARGVAPVRALIDGGVTVALASNNHQNAFTPVGGGGLLRAAWLASLVCQIGDRRGHEQLLDAVTSAPARILGLGQWDVRPGSAAPLIVLDAEHPLDAVREAPPVLARLT